MGKNLSSYILMLLSTLSLSGCIGTAFLFDPEECNKEFPNLGTVPAKPPKPDVTLHQATEEKMLSSQTEALEANKKLREQFQLKTEESCQ